MPDLDDDHDEDLIADLVNKAMVTKSNSIELTRALEFFHVEELRIWMLRKQRQRFRNFHFELSGEPVELLLSASDELYRILWHYRFRLRPARTSSSETVSSFFLAS